GGPVRAAALPPRAVTLASTTRQSATAATLAAVLAKQKAAEQSAEERRLRGMLTPVATVVPQGVIASHAPLGPRITSLSVSSGQPGDFVLITGSGFGREGEVHFV